MLQSYALFCKYSSSCLLSGCSFDNCSSKYPMGCRCIALNDIANCGGVKDSNATSCTAGWGGGVYIVRTNVTGTNCEGGMEYGVVS